MINFLESPGVLEIRKSILAGTTSLDYAVQQAFGSAQRLQPKLHAFAHLPETIHANLSDPSAPLAGVPVAVKDIFDTIDMPTKYGSPAYEGHQPVTDAWVVNRIRKLGATIIGKTVTTEFAWRHPGKTVNPWNPEYSPGGSSSGSAAAVAAGIVPLALGTQTFGSVIRPAAYCGVVGAKPSYGSIARTGVLPLSESLDHIGVFGISVAETTYALELLCGTDPGDPCLSHPTVVSGSMHGSSSSSHSISRHLRDGWRVGLLRQQVGGEVQQAQRHILDQVAARMRCAGATVSTVDFPAALLDASKVADVLVAIEAAVNHSDLVKRSPTLVSESMIALIEAGRAFGISDYIDAKRSQIAMSLHFGRWMSEIAKLDALLVAPAWGEAPIGLEFTGNPSFCTPWTFFGAPAITLPAGIGPSGLPIGVQMVGLSNQDSSLWSLAQWVEALLEEDQVHASAVRRSALLRLL